MWSEGFIFMFKFLLLVRGVDYFFRLFVKWEYLYLMYRVVIRIKGDVKGYSLFVYV